MAFEKKWLGEFRNTKANVIPVWTNDINKENLFELGLRLRQVKPSTIFNQAIEIALSKLQAEEKLSEILLGNERKNRRSGIEELEILRNELIINLKKNDKTKRDSDDMLIDLP